MNPTPPKERLKMIISDIMDYAEIKNTRAVSFDIIADICEKARPGYPDEVYEEIEKYTRVSPDRKSLSIFYSAIKNLIKDNA